MAGVVMVPLTEKELARVIEWGTWHEAFDNEDIALYTRLKGYQGSVACKVETKCGCAERPCEIPRANQLRTEAWGG